MCGYSRGPGAQKLRLLLPAAWTTSFLIDARRGLMPRFCTDRYEEGSPSWPLPKMVGNNL